MNNTAQNTIYCSFKISSSEFCLPVTSVQEVVNFPKQLTPMPLAPDYLMGMFNLRGTIIPVVRLNRLLKLADDTQSLTEKKVAIIEIQSQFIGILLDSTSEVFKSDLGEFSMFDYTGTTDEMNVISGAFKLEEGKRIIQILNPDAVLKLNAIPKNANVNGSINSAAMLKKKNGTRKKCISFHVGAAKCAVEINGVQEILKVPAINESAFKSEYCMGTIDVRGNLIPIINLSIVLGYKSDENTELTEANRVLVMKMDDMLLGFLVDSVDSLVSYFGEDVVAFPVLSTNRAKMFMGCIVQEGSDDVLLIDRNEILTNQEVQMITQGHSSIYKSTKVNQAAKDATKKSYITFRVGSLFGVEIKEIAEIIDFTGEYLKPPGIGKNFLGVLNLRGEMVSLIDAQKAYNLVGSDAAVERKVIVFKDNQQKYGLVVDSVEEIVHVNEEAKLKIPEVLYNDTKIGQDVKEAIEIVSPVDSSRKTLLILSVASVCKSLTESNLVA